MKFQEWRDGKTLQDSIHRADRAFRTSRDLLNASWIFSLWGQGKLGVAFLGLAIPVIYEMKRQHRNIEKRQHEKKGVFKRK